MTVENVVTGSLTHFRIKEKSLQDGGIDLKLQKIEGNFDSKIENKLKENVEKITKSEDGVQEGGKHDYDDSSSDSDSSSSDYDDFSDYRITLPVNKFIYFYLPYYKLINITPTLPQRFFFPTFNLNTNPTLEIRFDVYQI